MVDQSGDAPSVTIVVPTRNSARTLERCLASLRAQTHRCTVVVVDNRSTDQTVAIAQGMADMVLHGGPERSRQRNAGAAAAPADIFGFVDSDMILPPPLVAEAVAAIVGGAAAVVAPERSIGRGYWARVRQFERAFYVGVEGVEAARFFPAKVFDEAGRFDETMTGPEDWDLSIRATRLGPLARTAAVVDHDEGELSYRHACAKKGTYARGVVTYARRYGMRGMIRAADRPYLRRPWQLVVPNPGLGAGVVALKAGEAAAAVFALLRAAKR
jgi:glycosyltransferase involved in cell wall biosynthesis